MKPQILYSAVSVKIGRIANSDYEDYYLDIFESNGNQQTVATGTLKYLKSFMTKIEIKN